MADHQEMRNAVLRAIQKGAEDKEITLEQYVHLFFEDTHWLQSYVQEPVLA